MTGRHGGRDTALSAAWSRYAMVPDLRIAPMRSRHLPAVQRIERQVYPVPWSVGLFAAELSRPVDRRYLVALRRRPGCRRRREVVGYAGVLLQHTDAHVTTVAVHPALRRRRIGSCLVAAILEEAVDLGAAAVTLEVRAGNAAARRLYESFGFTTHGVRPGYYPDTGEDATIMWLNDLRSPQVVEGVQRRLAGGQRPGQEPD